MKRLVSLLLVVVLMLPAPSMAAIVDESKEMKADIGFVQATLDLIRSEYPFDLDEDRIIKAGVNAILQELDPYSEYISKEEVESLMGLTEGRLVGIGVVMEAGDGYVKLREVIPGNPAAKAGIKPGDILVAVDEEPVIGKNLEEISSQIRGEEGSLIKLRVKRGEKFLDFKFKREGIEINPVQSKIIDDIVYLSLDEFSKDSSRHLKNALDKSGRKKVILDLRRNPGGLMDEAVKIANHLFPEGDLVHIKYKKHQETLRAGKKGNNYDLIVLIDENSASASEILAGAVKDRKLGKLVGQTSYGKGTVQSLIGLTDGSVIRLTVAEYLPPSKKSINNKGVQPDYQVENKIVDGVYRDLQLEKAIELLKNK